MHYAGCVGIVSRSIRECRPRELQPATAEVPTPPNRNGSMDILAYEVPNFTGLVDEQSSSPELAPLARRRMNGIRGSRTRDESLAQADASLPLLAWATTCRCATTHSQKSVCSQSVSQPATFTEWRGWEGYTRDVQT